MLRILESSFFRFEGLKKKKEILRVIPYLDGVLKIEVDLETPLGLDLFRYQSTEADVRRVVEYLNPGDTFIDGGANIGLFTLAAAHKVGPAGKIFAFEPAKATRQKLNRNTELNHLYWVTIHSEALGEVEEEIDFYSFEGSQIGMSSFSPEHAALAHRERVTVKRLENFQNITHEEKNIRLIKLDLEGAEMKALRGMGSLWTKCRPAFLIEIEDTHLHRQNSSAAEILEFFTSRNYDCMRLPHSANYWMNPR